MKGGPSGKGHCFDFSLGRIVRATGHFCVTRMRSGIGNHGEIFTENKVGFNITTGEYFALVFAKSGNEKVSEQPYSSFAAVACPIDRNSTRLWRWHEGCKTDSAFGQLFVRKDKAGYTLTARYVPGYPIKLQENSL